MPKDTSLPPKSSKIVSYSSAETKILGEGLAPFLRAGDVISFSGDLGTGKTTFIQGLAKGLGIEGRVTSPTFTLIKEYHPKIQDPSSKLQVQGPRSQDKNLKPETCSLKPVGLGLYHFDLYRLRSFEELYDLGYEEYFGGPGITVIEWGEKIAPLLPEVFLEIKLTQQLSENVREIEIIPHGSRWERLVPEWLKKSRLKQER